MRSGGVFWLAVLLLLLLLPGVARELTEGEILRALRNYPILVVEVLSPTRVRIVDVVRGDRPVEGVVAASWDRPLEPHREVLGPLVGRQMIVVAEVSPGGELKILAFARYLDDPERRAWVRKEVREGCHCDDLP